MSEMNHGSVLNSESLTTCCYPPRIIEEDLVPFLKQSSEIYALVRNYIRLMGN